MQARICPDASDIDVTGQLVCLVRHFGDWYHADAVFILMDRLEADEAKDAADFLQSSPGVLFEMSVLHDALEPRAGESWHFVSVAGNDDWLAAKYDAGAVLELPDDLPFNADGWPALLMSLQMKRGAGSSLGTALRDYDYIGFRRRLLAMRAAGEHDRDMGLTSMRRKIDEVLADGTLEDPRLTVLRDDLDEALSGGLFSELEDLAGDWAVVIDLRRSYPIADAYGSLNCGVKTVVIGYGLSLEAAAWLHALVSAEARSFVLSDMLNPAQLEDDSLLSVRIVRFDQLGWVGVDLAGTRSPAMYAAVTELSHQLVESGHAMNSREVLDEARRIVMNQSREREVAALQR